MRTTLLSCILYLSTGPIFAVAVLPAPTTSLNPQSSAIPSAEEMNCQYHIPPTTTTLDPKIVRHWAENAAIQSFDYSYTNIDGQFVTLKPCFTEQGWESFNTALQHSGNLHAIKNQRLSVSSQIDGVSTIRSLSDNQWKVTVPVHVVYQNEQQRLSQSLTIDLLIGRKITGDLGITQLIATPRSNPTLPNRHAR